MATRRRRRSRSGEELLHDPRSFSATHHRVALSAKTARGYKFCFWKFITSRLSPGHTAKARDSYNRRLSRSEYSTSSHEHETLCLVSGAANGLIVVSSNTRTAVKRATKSGGNLVNCPTRGPTETRVSNDLRFLSKPPIVISRDRPLHLNVLRSLGFGNREISSPPDLRTDLRR